MYLSDLRMYFKVEVYFRVTWRSIKIAEKLADYANTTDVEIYCWPEGFISWLGNVQLFAHKLIRWVTGECADWFFDIIMTWSYCLRRRYSMSRQKNNFDKWVYPEPWTSPFNVRNKPYQQNWTSLKYWSFRRIWGTMKLTNNPVIKIWSAFKTIPACNPEHK